MSQPPLFFIHGMWSRPRVWDGMRAHFEAAGYATHAPALHFLPAGHCASVLHCTHLFASQTRPFLQSLSPLQPGFFGLSPQAPRNASTKASAKRTLPMA